MGKKVAILQSNYIPWKGYFDLIAYVDTFVLYDEVQFTKRDWRNRNQIKTPQGPQWLTVPVLSKGKYDQKIKDTLLDGQEWRAAHWKSLELNYRRAKHFEEVASWVKPLYLTADETHLSELNLNFIRGINAYLGIPTHIANSSDYVLADDRNERLLSICTQVDGDEYVSGPSAKDYLDEAVFAAAGVKVTWFDYSGYSEYTQQWGEFTHYVSILDLLFNCGKDAPRYMRHVQK